MSKLRYSHATGRLVVSGPAGQSVFAAQNNVDSQSGGPFPPGVFKFQAWNHHPEDGLDSPCGSLGIVLFDVAGRSGMGVHSGREAKPDALGRTGIGHATEGCIRTTDAAMRYIAATHSTSQIEEIEVE